MVAMPTSGPAPKFPPNATVDELPSEYVVHVPVPGFTLEELDVEVADRVVTVCADQTDTGIDTPPFSLHELVERFALPDDVDAAHVTASYARGQIDLHAPRTDGIEMKSRKVPIARRFAVNADASGV